MIAAHLDVGAALGRAAGGVIVHQDDGGGGELERALDHLASMKSRSIPPRIRFMRGFGRDAFLRMAPPARDTETF